ncbi:enoyl-CoA hydratase/isomerase family protein [Streptomyces rubradiris]|uniref:enoyl-CoA hydratase/isomerase family protein n=1 Tax=Streptomyces rubradiris TaxID=285531 RepID=UPI0016725C7E|nr:enoyl-CoA hydratase/isomerase family protein [Streptomyces rubradiris]GHH31197.1 putative enoyl-CoA hydratase/isomerase [Streptomyces rubradiris]
MGLINVEDTEGIRILTLAHEKPTNPFGKEMAEAFMTALRAADADDTVGAIVVNGGRDRSFSAGGDFNEVMLLATDESVDELIDWITDLYVSVLDTGKPTIAAIDRHAIGLGFQLAMMFDWKIVSTRANLVMPELEHGIGASMGAAILSTIGSYDVARHIIMGCRPIGADTAIRLGMADESCEPEFLLDRAVQRARRMARYPHIAFSATKHVLTDRLRTTLEQTREDSKAVHRKTFAAKAMHTHFNNILGKNREKAVSAAS